jgi:hypothetical protein
LAPTSSKQSSERAIGASIPGEVTLAVADFRWVVPSAPAT